MIEIVLYKDGSVRHVPDDEAMPLLESLFKLSGLRIVGSTSNQFEIEGGNGLVAVVTKRGA